MSKIWEVKETEVEMMRQMSVYVILEIKDMNKYEEVWIEINVSAGMKIDYKLDTKISIKSKGYVATSKWIRKEIGIRNKYKEVWNGGQGV